MKYFSMFSGIGTGEKGIEQAFDRYMGLPGTARQPFSDSDEKLLSDTCQQNGNGGQQHPLCVGFSEIDKYAEAIYRYHYPGHKNYGDATRIVPDELPDFDFLIGGFPCQAFSIAGKRKGFNDTRGTLFFEIARILRGKQPSHFLLENVKGLLSHNDGNTFATIISALDEIGYDIEWTVCNSKHFGVPQNRERVFIIGHLRGRCGRKILSLGGGNEEVNKADGRQTSAWITNASPREFGWSSVSGTLAARDYKEPKIVADCRPTHTTPRLIYKDGRPKNRDVASTLCGGAHSGGNHSDMDLPVRNARIRRLTPTECERLQGLPDGWTRLGRFGDEVREISDTQRYKGIGNAFTVNVIEWLMTQLIEGGCVE